MKRIILFIFILIINLFPQNVVEASSDQINNLVRYSGDITHVFTHCLLADPALALSLKNPMRNDYARDCITKDEFKKILTYLHKNNYILIDPRTTYSASGENTKKSPLLIPKGKKPLIFSFDDVNYDSKKLGRGMVDKLIIDKNGELATSTNKQGKTIISSDNEFVPILNQFVKNNPDFSHLGAKGLICLTGYDGILGYRTQAKNTKNRESEIQQCKKVVSKLKSDGWTFACHSFGHYHMKKISLDKAKDEINHWNNEVVPIIGKTDIYVYPYGEWEILDQNGEISKKHKLLVDDGFKLFCGVGIKPFFSYLPRNKSKEYQVLFMDRCPLDGYTLKTKGKDLSHLFPYENVLDKNYR